MITPESIDLAALPSHPEPQKLYTESINLKSNYELILIS